MVFAAFAIQTALLGHLHVYMREVCQAGAQRPSRRRSAYDMPTIIDLHIKIRLYNIESNFYMQIYE